MPAARAAADRKHPLPEDREQQEHAAGEAPSELDEHQRGDVRVPAHVPKSFDEIGQAGEGHQSLRPGDRPAASRRTGSAR